MPNELIAGLVIAITALCTAAATYLKSRTNTKHINQLRDHIVSKEIEKYKTEECKDNAK